MVANILFRCHDPPDYRFLVIGSPACRAQAVHILLDVVEAELADLSEKSSVSKYVREKVEVFHLTWYPQGHGLKFRSVRSSSSTQRGLMEKISKTFRGKMETARRF